MNGDQTTGRQGHWPPGSLASKFRSRLADADLSVVRLSVRLSRLRGEGSIPVASVTFLLFWHGASLG